MGLGGGAAHVEARGPDEARRARVVGAHGGAAGGVEGGHRRLLRLGRARLGEDLVGGDARVRGEAPRHGGPHRGKLAAQLIRRRVRAEQVAQDFHLLLPLLRRRRLGAVARDGGAAQREDGPQPPARRPAHDLV